MTKCTYILLLMLFQAPLFAGLYTIEADDYPVDYILTNDANDYNITAEVVWIDGLSVKTWPSTLAGGLLGSHVIGTPTSEIILGGTYSSGPPGTPDYQRRNSVTIVFYAPAKDIKVDIVQKAGTPTCSCVVQIEAFDPNGVFLGGASAATSKTSVNTLRYYKSEPGIDYPVGYVRIFSEGIEFSMDNLRMDLSPTIHSPVCTDRPPLDLNDDCRVSFHDFALLCAVWLDCGLEPPEACDM